MKINLVLPKEKESHLIAPFFTEDKNLEFVMRHLDKNDSEFLKMFLSGEKKSGVFNVFLPSKKKIVLIGKGKKDKWNKRKARILVRQVIVEMKRANIKSATIDAMSILDSENDLIQTLNMIGIEATMADYDFSKYKKNKDGSFQIESLSVAVASEYFDSKHKKAIEEGCVIGAEVNKTREIINVPGGDMTPAVLASHTKKESKNTKLKISILNKSQIERLGMGGVLGVAKGSDEEPKFIILEHYNTKTKNEKPLVLVGKGVTFDTGGLNVKPGSSMNEMHMDMSGGAAVIHSLIAISLLNIPLKVIGLVPAVENMPSGRSYRPGDILTSITGKTIEVLNTDAEGRVILADALGYASKFKPRMVLDIATLTGAAEIAVGTYASIFFTNEEKLERIMTAVGEVSGDYMWQLPLWEEYEHEVKGTYGDVANLGKGRAGSIAGGMFLKHFVDYPWVHIDMAPTMMANRDEFLVKGSKGTGVRFFVELARHLVNNK